MVRHLLRKFSRGCARKRQQSDSWWGRALEKSIYQRHQRGALPCAGPGKYPSVSADPVLKEGLLFLSGMESDHYCATLPRELVAGAGPAFGIGRREPRHS